jgi:hypothetical protein
VSVATAVGYDPTKSTAHHSARAYPAVASWLGRRELEGKAPRTRDGDRAAEVQATLPGLYDGLRDSLIPLLKDDEG